MCRIKINADVVEPLSQKANWSLKIKVGVEKEGKRHHLITIFFRILQSNEHGSETGTKLRRKDLVHGGCLQFSTDSAQSSHNIQIAEAGNYLIYKRLAYWLVA